MSLVRFYARRARRLLPAATLVLLATTLAGWWLLPRGRHADLGAEVLAATGYVVNWLFSAREVDYLAEDQLPSLVQHYWSLSVEEQFYVLWPLLIIVVLWVTCRLHLRLLPTQGVGTGARGRLAVRAGWHRADRPGEPGGGRAAAGPRAGGGHPAYRQSRAGPGYRRQGHLARLSRGLPGDHGLRQVQAAVGVLVRRPRRGTGIVRGVRSLDQVNLVDLG